MMLAEDTTTAPAAQVPADEIPPASAKQVELVSKIKACISRAEKAEQRRLDFYNTAGQYLAELKRQSDKETGEGLQWRAWERLLKKIGISTSRASDLMQIADGRKTTEQIRAGASKRQKAKRLRDVTKKQPKAAADLSEQGADAGDAPDETDPVADPETVRENLLYTLERHAEGARAVNKIIKAARLEDAARQEIKVAVERLISKKWRRVLSTLDRPRRKAEFAATKPEDMPTAEEAEESYQETPFDHRCPMLESMAGETRQKFLAHILKEISLSALLAVMPAEMLAELKTRRAQPQAAPSHDDQEATRAVRALLNAQLLPGKTPTDSFIKRLKREEIAVADVHACVRLH